MTAPTDNPDAAWHADYHAALHWFLVVLAVSTVFLLFVGAEVTSRGVGLAVPDWPLSYGQWMPEMVGGVFWEHGHRMVAAGVGFLMLVATVWCLAVERRRWVRGLTIGALGLVVAQGIAGGMTVLYKLPEWLSSTHAALGQTFLGLTFVLVIVTSKSFLRRGAEPGEPLPLRGLRVFVWVALAAIYAQILLGAYMRHHDAGLAIPTIPLAYGQWIPDLSVEAIEEYRWEMMDLFAAQPSMDLRIEEQALAITPFRVGLHFAHRVGAVVLLVVLGAFCIWTLVAGSREPILAGLAVAILGLLLLQIVLGILVVLSLKTFQIASLHLLFGALLLATTFSLIVWLYRLPAAPPASLPQTAAEEPRLVVVPQR